MYHMYEWYSWDYTKKKHHTRQLAICRIGLHHSQRRQMKVFFWEEFFQEKTMEKILEHGSFKEIFSWQTSVTVTSRNHEFIRDVYPLSTKGDVPGLCMNRAFRGTRRNLERRYWHNTFGLSQIYMGVSENSGTPKSSILIGFSIINHPFWGTSIFWKHPYRKSRKT